MNRFDFQKIAVIRLREAKALLADELPEGAYYLAGYAVECALKACIAKRTREHDFQDKKLAQESHTHNLRELFRVSELKPELDVAIDSDLAMSESWIIVEEWSETSRYETKSVQQATDLIKAIEDEGGGLLPWIMQRW